MELRYSGKQGFEKHQIVGRSIAYHSFSDFFDILNISLSTLADLQTN